MELICNFFVFPTLIHAHVGQPRVGQVKFVAQLCQQSHPTITFAVVECEHGKVVEGGLQVHGDEGWKNSAKNKKSKNLLKKEKIKIQNSMIQRKTKDFKKKSSLQRRQQKSLSSTNYT